MGFNKPVETEAEAGQEDIATYNKARLDDKLQSQNLLALKMREFVVNEAGEGESEDGSAANEAD